MATSVVHSKLDYCNSLYHNLLNYQLKRLQQIQNSLARAVVKAPKSSHITAILSTGLRVTNALNKNFSLTYKVLTTSQTSYLNNLISVQSPRSTRSSSVITLSRSPTITSLKIIDRSFRYASPRLWNNSLSCFNSLPHSLVSSSLSSSPQSSSITLSLFHSRLKTYLFNKSFPPQYFFYPGLPSQPRDRTGLIMLLYLFSVCFIFNFSVSSVWCTKLGTC